MMQSGDMIFMFG